MGNSATKSNDIKEHFNQGKDYLMSTCVQKCEMDLLIASPFFVQLQEGGYRPQNYCREICASEYNIHNLPTNQGVCSLRRIPYSVHPLKQCQYFECDNRSNVIPNFRAWGPY